MTVIGKASIDIRANDKFFERDVKKMANGIKDISVNVKTDVQISAVTKKLNDFRRRQEKRVLNLKSDISTDLVESRIDKIWEDNDGRVLNMNLDFDHTSAWKSLARLKESVVANSSVVLNAELDMDDLYKQMEGFIDEFEGTPIPISLDLSTGNSAAQFEAFQAAAENNNIAIDADVDTLSAEAKLALLARNRRAKILVALERDNLGDLENILAGASSKAFRIFEGGGNPIAKIFRDPEVANAIEGFGNATLGIVPPRQIKSTITGLAAEFEEIAIQSAVVGNVVGAIGSGLLTATGFAANLVVDLSQIIGVASVIPAAIAGGIAATQALSIAWQGFSDAMVADPQEAAKAIAELHPPARETAWALQEIVQGVTEATQTSYWKTLGDAVEDAADTIKDDLVEGMSVTATEMAENTGAMADAVKAFGEAGGVATTFENINQGLDNASRGTGLFTEALLTLTEEGSKKLPELGEYFSDVGDQFNNFIQTNADNGNILAWVDIGVQRLQELGTILGNTGSIISAVATSAKNAGIGGLTEMAEGFERVADIVNGDTFQMIATGLFRDSATSFSAMSSGVGELLDAVGSKVPQIGDIFIIAGETIESAMTHISNAIEDSYAVDGIEKLFEGVRSGVEQMGPAAMSFGNIVGDLSEMFGSLIDNMAPGFNQVLAMVEGFINNMKGGWLEVMPVLNDAVQLIVGIITGPIQSLGGIIGGVMSVISNIPTPVLAAVGALVAMVGPVMALTSAFKILGPVIAGTSAVKSLSGITSAFAGFRSGATTALTGVRDNARKMGDGVKQVGTGLARTVSSVGGSVASMGLMTAGAFDASRAASDTAARNAGGLGTAWAGARTTVAGAAGGIKSALGGIGSALKANALVVGLLAITTALAATQKGAEEAELSVGQFTENFNNSIGSLNVDNLEHASERIKDLNSNWLTDWGILPDFGDTLDKVGMDPNEISTRLSGSRQEIEDYAGSWNHINKAMEGVDAAPLTLKLMGFNTTLKDMIKSMDPSVIAKTGYELDELLAMSDSDLRNVISGMGQISEEALEGLTNAKLLKDELSNISGVFSDDIFTSAENGSTGLLEALTGANEQAGALTENFDTLRNTSSSVDQVISAMKSNMEILGLQTMNVGNPMKEWEASIDANSAKMKEFSESGAVLKLDTSEFENGISTTLNGSKQAMFDFSDTATREMHTILSSQADMIHAVAGEAYSTTLKETGSVNEAVDAAVGASKGLITDVESQLRSWGVTSDSQINGILDSMGLLDEDIKASFLIDGIDAAISEMARTEMLLHGLKTGNWDAYFNVITDDAENQLQEIFGEVEGKELSARIGTVLNDTEYADFMMRLESGESVKSIIAEMDDGEAKTQMEALLKGGTAPWSVDPDVATISTFREAMEATISVPYTLDADPSQAQGEFTLFKDFVENNPSVNHLDLLTEPAQLGFGGFKDLASSPISSTLALLTGGALGQVSEVKTEASAPQSFSVSALIAGALTSIGVIASTASDTDASVGVETVDVNSSAIIGGLANQAETGATFPINLDLGQLEHMRGVLRHYQNTSINISTSVSMGGVEHLRGVLSTYKNTVITVTANVSMGGIEHLRGVLSSYRNTNINVTTSVSMGGIEHMRGVLSAYKNTTVTVTSVANLSGVNAVSAALGGIADKTVTIHGNNSPANGAINHIRGALASLPDKTVTIRGQNAPANGAINHIRGALASLRDKMVTIRANNSPANGAINHIRGALASLRDRTVTITTVNKTVNQGNNGMMMAGNVRTFANGGMDPRMAKALSRVQKKKENHVAQIAPGSNNFRVWGEAETGGEAYIPLSKAKRARSMAILEQVASHFGVALSRYADGGYNMGGKSMGSGITAFASGGTTATDRATKAREQRERVRDLRVDFTESAKNALSSFSESISDQFGRTTSPVNESVNGLRESLREAIGSLEGTNKAQANIARKFRTDIAAQRNRSGIWNNGGTDGGLEFLDRNVSSAGLTRVGRRAKITLLDLEYAQESLNLRLERARDLLDDINNQYDSARSSIRSGLEGELDFSSLLGETDEFGYRAPVTARSISEYAKDYNRKLKSFGGKLNSLRKAGYNSFLVDEIANMGLEDGTYLADALLSDRSFLSSINASYTTARGRYGKDEDGMYGLVGGMADTIGKASADAMFGASKQATEGLIKGMEGNLANIEKLGRTMANSLTTGFKKALGIKSPSRVFMKQADYIAQGLVEGFDKNQSLLDSRVSNLIQPRKLSTSFGEVNAELSSNDIMNRQTYADREPIAVHVHPSAGMDETLIGNSAARELQWRLDER